MLMCSQCPKIYKRTKNRSGRAHKYIREHITKCHNAVDDSDSDYDTDDDCPQLSKRDEDDSDDESETGANDSDIHDVLEPENYYDCNDFDDDNECGLPEYSFEDHIDFKNDVSNAFFRQDYDMYHTHEELFGGFRGLCWRARHGQQLYDRENIASINHAKFMFYMTSLIEDNTTSTNQKLFNIFNEIHNLTGHALKNSDIVVPTNSITSDRVFMRGEHGVFNNLPCPSIHDVQGHVCFRIDDIISHHLALGRDIDFTRGPGISLNRTKMHDTVAMWELLRELRSDDDNDSQIYYGYFTTWSDSFLRSYVKQKLNNVWMYTITLPNLEDNSLSKFHTYCIAVGPGYLDHTAVIDWYSVQIESLMEGKLYYCSVRRKIIQCKFGVLACLADRPEKSFILKTALLGTFGKVASWAAEIQPNILADCSDCFETRLKHVLTDCHSPCMMDTCRRCCQWDLNSSSQSLKKIDLPAKYPTVEADGCPPPPFHRSTKETYVHPVYQTFKFLVAAVLFATYNVTNGVWNKGMLDAYLRTCAVSKTVREYIWKSRKSSDNHDVPEASNEDEGCDSDGELDDGYAPLMTSNGLAPVLWYCRIAMNAFIDCGMHLIFHGIVAYVIEIIATFVADHGKTPQFLDMINPHLVDIANLRLEWCKTKTFPKKQWLAENELGLARVLPFVYGMLILNINLPRQSNTTTKTQHAILQMINSLHVMVCTLMSPRDLGSDDIDAHVKLFLSCCHRYCLSYYSASVKPFWSNTGNFPTLLCLAKQRERHGPIRWYWEGTSERFIQQLKKVLVAMRRTPTYFAGKMRLMYRRNVIDWINESMFVSEEERMTKRQPRMYYHYHTPSDIIRYFKDGRVLSGFTLKSVTASDITSEKIMIAFGNSRRSGRISMMGLNRVNKGNYVARSGLMYVECELDTDDLWILDESVGEVESIINNYCLLLPLVQTNRGPTIKYAVIFEDWDVGDEYFVKSMPRISKECFEMNVL